LEARKVHEKIEDWKSQEEQEEIANLKTSRKRKSDYEASVFE